MQEYPFYSIEKKHTLSEFVDWCSDNYQDKCAFSYKVKNEMVSVSYYKLRNDIRFICDWIGKSFQNVSHIAIIGENSYTWIVSFLAITYGGRVAIPLDKDMPIRDILDRLSFSDSQCVLLSNTYADYKDAISDSGYSVVMMNEIQHMIDNSIELSDITGINTVCPQTLAAIFFTSGTTGKPKGVMLSHINIMSDTHGGCSTVEFIGKHYLLLPLHHTFGLTAGTLCPLYYGLNIYIPGSLRTLSRDIKEIQPETMVCVPIFIESLYNSIWKNIRDQGKEEEVLNQIKISNDLLKKHNDKRRVMFSSIIENLGGKLSLFISGGAPINMKYITGFEAFGIMVINGYGITECSPIISTNRNRKNCHGTVGKVIPCNKVKIADDGEILVRGENVMMGYYKNENETTEVMADGWYHTGDIGELSDDQYLTITGRKKNLIILSNGENISPEELEGNILEHISCVKEVVVRGINNGIEAECYINEGDENKLEQEIKALNKLLVPNKRITSIKTRNVEFPKTSTKKIIR